MPTRTVLFVLLTSATACSEVAPPDERSTDPIESADSKAATANDVPVSQAPDQTKSDPQGDASAPDSAGCIDATIDDGACVDIVALKDEASNELCSDGLGLAEFNIDVGDCDQGQARWVTYSCCPPVDQPPPPDKTPSDGGGSTCSESSLEVSSCQDTAALDASAADVCNTAGQVLIESKYAGDCPDGQATDSWFVCCEPSTDD